MFKFTYEVQGRGQFPWDMLRYDNASPADGSAVAVFEQATEAENGYLPKRVTIKLNSNQKPTIGRWLSFGWGVELNPA